MTVPRIVICLRATVVWDDEAAFYAQLDPAFAPKVDVWNRTFSLPYHRFRAALRALAADNHATLPGLSAMAWSDVPDHTWVLPVDDDDWFSPRVHDAIAEAARPDLAGIRWSQCTIEVPINIGHRLFLFRRRLVPSIPPRWLCSTNNYAMRKGVMGSTEFLKHTAASRRFANAHDVSVLPHYLSVHNRSLASITSLGFTRQQVSQRYLRAKWNAYLNVYQRWQVQHDELEWTIPLVQRMCELMHAAAPR